MSFDWILPLLRDFLERRGAASAAVSSAEPAVSAFENNCSELTRVRLLLKQRDGQTRPVTAIVKLETEAIIRVKPNIREMGLMMREITVYTEILRPMEKIFSQYGYEIMWPECWGYRSEDAIIMDDLKTTGHTTGDRLRGFDVEQLTFLVRELAKFHALAAVSQERGLIDPAQLPRYPFASRQEHSIAYLEDSFRSVRDLTAPMWPEASRQRYANILEKLPNIAYEELIKTLDRPGFRVFNHGDFWVNNLLIQYDEATGKPTNLKMVDFQMAHFSSFAMDLHYLLTMSMQEEYDREEVIDSLIVEYQASLERALEDAEYGKTPPTLEEVRSEIEATLFFRLVAASMLLCIAKQNNADVSDSSPLKGDVRTRSKCRYTNEYFSRVLLRKYDQLWNCGFFKTL